MNFDARRDAIKSSALVYAKGLTSLKLRADLQAGTTTVAGDDNHCILATEVE